MAIAPQCPHCHSKERPLSVRQEHEWTTVLVLFCPSCGSILAAADVSPHYPDLRDDGRNRAERIEA